MKKYTGWEWLLIDAANHFGKDKLTFEERIKWTEERIGFGEGGLEIVGFYADDEPLFRKAVLAIRRAQRGEEIGHMVGVDASCSGIQIMSAMTRCEAGCRATGLIDPDVRADAYGSITKAMTELLGASVNISRADAKDATMKAFYGSRLAPIEIFGADTPEINAFYQAAHIVAPGAWELLQDLLGSWQPMALSHEWKLPDGFDARVKVMSKKQARVEVDELEHASFTYEFYDNEGQAKGLSNAANVVHSVDAWILRNMHRRCNYEAGYVKAAQIVIQMELIRRSMGHGVQPGAGPVGYHKDQYVRTSIADPVVLPFIDEWSVQQLCTDHLQKLMVQINSMLSYKPFSIVSIHDAFYSHANNVNEMRRHYREILAEIVESNLIGDLLGQIIGKPVDYQYQVEGPAVKALANKVRNSAYALT